jgi:hypothetical protein
VRWTIGLFCVLTILHIATCITTRWLAGKTQELAEFQFGVRDMGRTVDLMKEAFEKIASDGEIMLGKEFMLNIFEPIVDHLQNIWYSYLKIRKGMCLDQEKRPTSGCLLMSCTQNNSFPLGTTFVKHILLLVTWQKLLLPTS